MANGLLDFNVFQPRFVGRPVSDIGQMVDYRRTQDRQLVDNVNAIDIAMSNVDINPLDVGGQQMLAERQQALKQGVSDIVDTGNYKLAPAIVNKLSKDFITDKGIQTAVENQAAYNANRAKLQERYEKAYLKRMRN